MNVENGRFCFQMKPLLFILPRQMTLKQGRVLLLWPSILSFEEVKNAHGVAIVC